MDLWNAKLQRIDRPTVDVEGQTPFTNGSSIDVQCVIDGPSRRLAMTTGATLEGWEATLYVVAGTLPANEDLQAGYRVTVQPWDVSADVAFGPPRTWLILRSAPMPGGELTHWECLLKGA